MSKRARIIAATVSVAVVLFAWLVFAALKSPEEDIQAMRGLGVPTTYQELDAMVPSQGQDAWPLYRDVIDQLGDGPKDALFRDLAEVRQLSADPKSPRLNNVSLQLAPLRAIVHRASKLPRCSFPSETRDDGIRTYGSLVIQMVIWQLMIDSATVESAQGRPVHAFNDLSSFNGIAWQLAAQPDFMAFSHASTQYEDFLRTWRDCLRDHSRNREAVAAALQAVSYKAPELNPRWLIYSSVPEVLNDMRRSREYSREFLDMVKEDRNISWWADNPVAVRRGTTQVVRHWRNVCEKISNDSLKWNEIQQILREEDQALALSWPANQLWSHVFEIYAQQCSKGPRAIAAQRVAKASARALQYRLDHGDVPASLDANDPEARDPFRPQELLRYRRHNKGFVIYSVGENFVDDGGPVPNTPLFSSDIGMMFE